MTSYVTLDSQDGVATHETGVLRYPIDSVFRHVSEVEWLTMEIQNNHALTITATSNTLYFSEDLKFFKAQLPCGSYTCASLHKAIEAAMCCATDVMSPESQGPQNGYSVRMLADSSRLCISSDGSVPFCLHNCQQAFKIRSVRRLGKGDAQVTIWCHDEEPIARGSVLRVFRPGKPAAVVQVIHEVGSVLLIRQWGDDEGVCLAEGENVDVDEDWTLQPLCQGTSLPELLGLGLKDLRSNHPIPVMHSSSPLLGNAGTSVSRKSMHLGLARPHGCVEGDAVLLDGFEGGFMNGQEAKVLTVVSEQQVAVEVDASRMAAFVSTDVVRFSVQGHDFSFRVGHAMVMQAQENSVCVKIPIDRADVTKVESLKQLAASIQWLPVKMLSPVPCGEWVVGRVSVKVDTTSGKYPGSLLLRCKYHHKASPDACIKRNAVVGVKKMNLLHQKSVLLMRLRLGMTEAKGVWSLKDNNVHVFGRAQMKEGGFLAAHDHSLVGKACFHPPLEHVSYVDVGFVTSQGCPVQSSVLGDYSLLLQFRMAP